MRQLQPKAVLEIGTHVGASTIHIAAALNRASPPGRLTTVDRCRVNDPVEGAWAKFGCVSSPAGMLERLGCRELVRFVASDSLDYLTRCAGRYDLIFLDGSHAATTVYQEIPAALACLNPGGRILLHDYYPDLTPLWSDGALVPGPWLAVARLRSEGARIETHPLGELPWPTKRRSHRTSLAPVVAHARRERAKSAASKSACNGERWAAEGGFGALTKARQAPRFSRFSTATADNPTAPFLPPKLKLRCEVEPRMYPKRSRVLVQNRSTFL